MPTSLIVFLKTSLNTTEEVAASFQEDFDNLLKDTFSDEELELFEPKVDAIAAVFVQPMLSDLSFDDFYTDENEADAQRIFFENCKSSISFENIPYLESNPFQVTYLKEFLSKFDDFLIDRGGISELQTKEQFLKGLESFKSIDSLLGVVVEKPKPSTQKVFIPVDPIDFLIVDVYKELERLKDVKVNLEEIPEKLRKLFCLMRDSKITDQSLLFQRSGLNAKDFDDGLERLKFLLRKI